MGFGNHAVLGCELYSRLQTVSSPFYHGSSWFTIKSLFQGPYQVGVVAVEDSTTVTFEVNGQALVSVSYGGNPYTNGDRLTVNLNAYETFQVQIRYFINRFTISLSSCTFCFLDTLESMHMCSLSILNPLRKLYITFMF